MKKIFTLVVLLATMTVAVQAQVKFGVKGGLNLTSMKLDASVADKSNQAGFFIGPTVKFTLPVVGLSLDASALYDQRQGKIKGTDQTIKSQSIQIPINVRYGFGLSSVVNVFAFAGPQFGFNIGDKSKLLDQIGEWSLKSSNISGNVGIGATVFSKLQITANYNFQLSKTGEVEYIKEDGTTGTGKLKFNSWQLGLGYYF